jgi:hypothetical protein
MGDSSRLTSRGWASLIASIYFIGGIIIGILGVIGIYLGKTFDEGRSGALPYSQLHRCDCKRNRGSSSGIRAQTPARCICQLIGS